jgi:hypothetical protein
VQCCTASGRLSKTREKVGKEREKGRARVRVRIRVIRPFCELPQNRGRIRVRVRRHIVFRYYLTSERCALSVFFSTSSIATHLTFEHQIQYNGLGLRDTN